MDQDEKLGATGQFPQGKLNKDDEGELKIAVGVDLKKRVVIIQFGKKVSWIGLDPRTAKALADSILAKTAELTQ